MSYFNKVFGFRDPVKSVSDIRKRRTYSLDRLFLAAPGVFLLQYPGLGSVFNGHGCMDRKLLHLLGRKRKIPGRYAVEDMMASIDARELNGVLTNIGLT